MRASYFPHFLCIFKHEYLNTHKTADYIKHENRPILYIWGGEYFTPISHVFRHEWIAH